MVEKLLKKFLKYFEKFGKNKIEIRQELKEKY